MVAVMVIRHTAGISEDTCFDMKFRKWVSVGLRGTELVSGESLTESEPKINLVFLVFLLNLLNIFRMFNLVILKCTKAGVDDSLSRVGARC